MLYFLTCLMRMLKEPNYKTNTTLMVGPNGAIMIEIKSKKSNIDKNEIKHRNKIKEILEMSEATIIIDCISSTFVSILFNGRKLQPFNQSHEIRQRDSLSPYIFFLCLEYLGLLIYGKREMICLQHFHNIFTTNSKWQVVTSCYCWDKKVILVLGLNLNL